VKRLYVYGVLAASGCIDGVRLGGDDLGPVRVVRHRGVDAVVSDYSGRDLQSLPREVVLRRLLAHQRVVERAMAGSTVLPVKFGTVLSGYQDLHACTSS
jgi:Gas vesicle synthesis protein GvpL/GvpF